MSQDTGTLSELEWSDTYYADCFDDRIQLNAVCAVLAKGTTSEEWNRIDQNGSNIWRFDFHFEDRPKELLGPCTKSEFEQYWAEPVNFDLKVAIGADEDPGQLYFDSPDPGDSDDSNNDLLDIIGGSGDIYKSIGATVGNYLLSSSSSVDLSKKNNDSTFVWDIGLGGTYSDLPRREDGEIQATQVSLRVENEYGSGTHGVKYTPEYTFSYIKFDGSCRCGYTYPAYKTTAPFYSGYADYDVA